MLMRMIRQVDISGFFRRFKRKLSRKWQPILFRWSIKMLFENLAESFNELGQAVNKTGQTFNEYMKKRGKENAN